MRTARDRFPSVGSCLPAVVPEADVAQVGLPLARCNHHDLVVAVQWLLAASEGLRFGHLGREVPVVGERPRKDLVGEIPFPVPWGLRPFKLLSCLFLFRLLWGSSHHGHRDRLARALVLGRFSSSGYDGIDDLVGAQGHGHGRWVGPALMVNIMQK